MKLKTLMIGVFAGALMLPTTAQAQMFDGNTLIGAGLGGVLGSQLAGSGARTEGSYIGAALGGLIGSSMSRRNSRYGGGYYGGGNYQGGLRGHSYYGGSYGTFGGTYYPSMPAPHYVRGPNVVQTYTYPSMRTYVYQPAPRIIQPPVVRHVYHPAPVLAPVVHKVIHHTPAPVQPVRTVHIYKQAAPTQIIVPAPVLTLPAPQSGVYCYAGSSKRYDSHGHEIGSGNCN